MICGFHLNNGVSYLGEKGSDENNNLKVLGFRPRHVFRV